MRTEPELHNAVRDLYTAIMLTFAHTGAYKIVENSNGEAVIGMFNINIPQLQEEAQPTENSSPPVLGPKLHSAALSSRKTRRRTTRKK
jgi:hypothetical protein